jgi:superfamily II DNA or RNA helicase
MSSLTFTTLGKTNFSLHPYQQESVDKTTEHFYVSHKPSAIIQLATGAGKTVTVGMLIRKLVEEGKANRTLFVVHRTELVKQAIDTFELCGLDVGREQGSERGFSLSDPHVVCSTVQTMSRRLKQYKPTDFDLIICDECHHSAEGIKTYNDIYDYFSEAKLLGVTATIDRADRRSLERFGEVICNYSLYDAIHDPAGPFLSPVKFVRCSLGVDLRGCKTTGKKGDFDAGDLARRIQPAVELFANAIEKETRGRKKIVVFMPDVGSSQAMANALKQLGHAADWVSGEKDDRDQTIYRYKKGLLRYLVNCQILTEGFDDKPTDCVVLKPTRSRIAYAQMVGRGTRIAPDKDDCLIVDFSHTTDLDLIGPASLADCDIADRDEVQTIVDQGVDLWEAVERVKKEKQQRLEMRVPVSRLELQYRRVEINPFNVSVNLGLVKQMNSSKNRFGEPPTPAQAKVLENAGIKDLSGITKRQAGEIIGKIFARRESGLCTVKQLNFLVSCGLKPETVRQWSFQQASNEITKILGDKNG